MNFLRSPVLSPLRVLIVNPLIPASQLVIVKILKGLIFGSEQYVDLILLVYSDEASDAEALKLELEACAFSCYNSITITSDLPSVSDADVFCFMTNFRNPNCLDVTTVDGDDEQFDALYLIIKIASNLVILPEEKPCEPFEAEKIVPVKSRKPPGKKPLKPIFMADGLVAIDILKSFSKNLPPDSFFCSTSVPSTAASVLGDYLKVTLAEMNRIYAWAANDVIFHVEFEKSFFVNKKKDHEATACDWEMMTDAEMSGLSPADKTLFGPSWMRKEFIEKTSAVNSNNPHGSIYKAVEFAKTLRAVWEPRLKKDLRNNANVGIISDGSLGTHKGLPYVLPLILSGESWTVNDRFWDEFHVQLEMQRINKTVKEHHSKLIDFCKIFLQKNVINQAFVPVESTSTIPANTTTCTSLTDA